MRRTGALARARQAGACAAQKRTLLSNQDKRSDVCPFSLSIEPVQKPDEHSFAEMNGVIGTNFLATIAANTAIIIKVNFLGFKLYGLGRAKRHTFATPRTRIPFLSGL
jgi:hypothetical protein